MLRRDHSMNGAVNQRLDEADFGESKSLGLKSFDAFPKTKSTYRTTTRYGTLFTILTTVAAIYLLITEFNRFITGKTTHSFAVEKGVAHDLQLNMDIVVRMPCRDLHVNVQDASGDRILAGEKLKKDPTMWSQWGKEAFAEQAKRLEENPQLPAWMQQQVEQYTKVDDVHEYLGAARQMRKMARTPRVRGKPEDADSCRIYGSFEGNKVQGDFHITARGHGYAETGVHLAHQTFNFSHHINELSFGAYFPDIAQPLDHTYAKTDGHFYRYQYYLNVVPTIYTDVEGELTSTTPLVTEWKKFAAEWDAHERRKQSENPSEPDLVRGGGEDSGFGAGDVPQYNPFRLFPHTIYTNQYAVTEQSREMPESMVPGIFFKYDIEPILLVVSEEWGGVISLFITCINVVAGVMVAAGWTVALLEWVEEVWGRRGRMRSMSTNLLPSMGGEKKAFD